MRRIGYGWLARGLSLLLAVALIALPQQAAGATGTIRHAKPAGLTTGKCLTWGTACTLTRAVSVAVSGDQVWAKRGVYYPTTGTDPTKSFHLKNGVAIYGGFKGSETALSQRDWVLNQTFLSGDIGTNSTFTDDSYHVVVGGTAATPTNATAVLDGFYIVYGYARGSSPDSFGGGIYNEASSPTLRNLVIMYNTAEAGTYTAGGAGVANVSGSSPVMTNIVFQANQSKQAGSGNALGGAIYNGLNSSPKMTRLKFSSNSATSGGAMYNYGPSAPSLTNGYFTISKATANGGAIYNYDSALKLTNVTLDANSAADGGALYSNASNPILVNVTIQNNYASSYGGGIYNQASSPQITNATFNSNLAASSGNALYNASSSNPQLYNSILWGDSAPEVGSDGTSSILMDYGIIQGGCPMGNPCTNLISADPVLGPLQDNGGFAETMALGTGSGGLDTGNPNTCPAKDERGVARPQGAGCDLGAYEVRAMKFVSNATYDGQVLESGSAAGKGGTANSTSTTFRVGDSAQNLQYRGFLSFNVDALPDTATPTWAIIRADMANSSGDPTGNLSTMHIELAKPYFGTGLSLVPGDFQAAITTDTMTTFMAVSGTWFSAPIWDSTALADIGTAGTVQFRLRFSLPTDNDGATDYMNFVSANATTASYRPTLVVYYNP